MKTLTERVTPRVAAARQFGQRRGYPLAPGGGNTVWPPGGLPPPQDVPGLENSMHGMLQAWDIPTIEYASMVQPIIENANVVPPNVE